MLRRDSHTCQRCGSTDNQLDVHHIIPRRDGGSDDLENLKTLCSYICHNIEESIDRRIKRGNIRKKTVWIPEDIDIALRIIAAKENKGFSDISEEAYKLYLAKKEKSK